MEIVAPAHMPAIDEYLRDGPAARSLQHLGPFRTVGGYIDFLKCRSFSAQERLGAGTVSAIGRGIDFDFGHGDFVLKYGSRYHS